MRALILGGTGAMGAHLCKMLAERGYEVTCTSRSSHEPQDNISYAVGDAKNPVFLDGLLSSRWDAIIDFMVWSTTEFMERYRGFLAATDQYVFTSSYRVYANSPVINENSSRLLDVVDDSTYLATDEYALSKARCEDMLFCSGELNWTVIRPAVTYDGSNGRLQLGVFESQEWLWRALNGVPVPMPTEMLDRRATMSYGADVAQMICLLIGSPDALGETFTVSSSDYMTWREVAESYAKICSLEIVECKLDDFISLRGGVYQIIYDRMYDRVVDNSKVLSVTGMDPSELTPMRVGVSRELAVYLATGGQIALQAGFQGKMDYLCGGFPSATAVFNEGGCVAAGKYLVRRLTGLIYG